MSNGWPGGYIAQIQARVVQQRPGRADGEIDVGEGPPVRLLADGDPVGGVDAGEEPGEVAGVIWGPDGVGLTSSTLHDARGPVGTAEQILTLRRTHRSVCWRTAIPLAASMLEKNRARSPAVSPATISWTPRSSGARTAWASPAPRCTTPADPSARPSRS
jgi:hypothetical protein